MSDNFTLIYTSDNIKRIKNKSIPTNTFDFFKEIMENENNISTSSIIAGLIKPNKKKDKQILSLFIESNIIEKKEKWFGLKTYQTHNKGKYWALFEITYYNKYFENISEFNITRENMIDDVFELKFIGFEYSGANHTKILELNERLENKFPFRAKIA